MKIDRIFRLCYTGYADRAQRLAEATRAATSRLCSAEPITIWQFHSPWERWILDRAPHIPFLDSHPRCFGATVGHYRAVKTALELWCEGALFLEDDARFRKGADIALALAKAPADAAVLMLDHFSDREAYGAAAGGWKRVRGAYSSACYAASRAALRALADAYEAPATGDGSKLARTIHTCDNYTHEDFLGAGHPIYAAVPNLAAQCLCPGESNCGREHCLGKYARMGVDLNDFDGF